MNKNKKNKKKKATALFGDRGPTWKGLFERKTPSKTEKQDKAEKKHKGRFEID